MREHAIPQDVVGYRFHIVGNMTLKQFLEVGAGCVLGVFLYNTNLYPAIKWPLIGLSVAVGAMAAFVPFEERPLDHWLVTFVKVLYKPTKFFWKKEPKIPDPFLFHSGQNQNVGPELDLSPARRQRIKEYLSSLNSPLVSDAYELAELERMNSILASFQDVQVTQITTGTVLRKPTLTTTPHGLKKRDGEEDVVPTSQVRIIEENVLPSSEPHQGYNFNKAALDVSQVARNIQIPEVAQVTIATEQDEEVINNAQAVTQDAAFSTTLSPNPIITATQDAQTNKSLPFPVKPTEPNKVVGMILSPRDELINDAIVEIQTSDGAVVRAVKTNALGQFFVTTPLPDGNYTLLIEKDGFQFNPLNLQLTGAAVDPVEIRSN